MAVALAVGLGGSAADEGSVATAVRFTLANLGSSLAAAAVGPLIVWG
jgi:hypothetical protein